MEYLLEAGNDDGIYVGGLVITGIFFVSFVILFVCAWIIYTRVERVVISQG